MKDVLPVVLLEGLREALAEGAALEVHCATPVTFTDQKVVRGEWKFAVRQMVDGKPMRRVLVTQRNIRHRVFTTAAGVASFAVDLGATAVTIPMVEGEVRDCEIFGSRST